MAIMAHKTQFEKNMPIEPTEFKMEPGVMKIPEPMMVVPKRLTIVISEIVGLILKSLVLLSDVSEIESAIFVYLYVCSFEL